MVARLTRQLLAFQLAAMLVVVAALHLVLRFGWGVAASIAFIILIAVRMSISLNNFALAWRYHSATPIQYRVNVVQALRLFFVEFYASIWSSSWAMPFMGFADAPVPQSAQPPVLLVHGYGCNSGYWVAMRRVLDEAGIVHRAIDLEPIFGDIEHYVPTLAQAIEALCHDSGQGKVIVLAHSMGGLAARAYLRRHGAARLKRLITLGTPHHGTGIANFGAGMNCRQMHWRGNAKNGAPSPWLRKLDEGEDAATRALIVSIYSHHDNIVSPQASSNLGGARNIEFGGVGHVALALDHAIQAQVLKEIHAAWDQAAHSATPACEMAGI